MSILKLRSDTVSELCALKSLTLPKSATRASKIRALAASTSIKEACSREELDKIEAVLVSEEEKRKNKKGKEKNQIAEEEDLEDGVS